MVIPDPHVGWTLDRLDMVRRLRFHCHWHPAATARLRRAEGYLWRRLQR